MKTLEPGRPSRMFEVHVTAKEVTLFLWCAWILGLVAAAWIGPHFWPHDPDAINVARVLQPPSEVHWMGTDQLGRDVLSRMMHGARISLFVGFAAVLISTVIGVAVGASAGYFGGKVDWLLMAFVDIMLCFPTFFLILACVALLEPSLFHIMVIIGLTGWMGIARLVRAEILSLKEREVILAARSLGASHARILSRHLIPNAMGPVFVTAILGVAGAILTESSLSFLGIGVQPPTPSWGNILTDGKAALGVAWWLTLFPGAAIFLTVLGYNMIGEALREALDVRRKA